MELADAISTESWCVRHLCHGVCVRLGFRLITEGNPPCTDSRQCCPYQYSGTALPHQAIILKGPVMGPPLSNTTFVRGLSMGASSDLIDF